MLGLGVSATLIDDIGPSVICTPLPNQIYTITPSSKLYIAAARDMSSRDPITDQLKEQACEIDFSRLESSSVLLVHNNSNEIRIQTRSHL